MISTMMDQALTITSVMKFADKIYPQQEIVSVTADQANFRYTYAEAFQRTRQLANALQGVSELQSVLSEYRKEYKSLPSLQGKRLEKSQNHFELHIKKVKQLIANQENKQHLLEWQEVQRKATLCRKVFHDRALADTAMDDEFSSKLDLPKTLEDALKTLWISVKAGSLSKERCIDVQAARALCIACEIAAGLDSPLSEKELRMQLQVSRLSEGMSSSSENLSREQQLNASLQKWYDSVGPTVEEFSQLEPRIENTIQHLFAE